MTHLTPEEEVKKLETVTGKIPTMGTIRVKDLIKEAELALIQKIEEWAGKRKREVLVVPPYLRQYENGGSAPFYCSLCQMSELDIMENKTNTRGKNEYFCKCSYWSDPHNAYTDKSGGVWLGWISKTQAKKMIEGFPCEDNFYNEALFDLLSYLHSLKDNKE